MILYTEITLKDHFIDSLRQSYSTLWGWLLPAIITGISLMNEQSWKNLNDGDLTTIIVYYFIVWAGVNAAQTLIFTGMSMFGPLKNSRGLYEISIDGDRVIDKGPTNSRIIEIGQISTLKSDLKNGIEFKMKDGRSDGVFCRGNSPADIQAFIDDLKAKMS